MNYQPPLTGGAKTGSLLRCAPVLAAILGNRMGMNIHFDMSADTASTDAKGNITLPVMALDDTDGFDVYAMFLHHEAAHNRFTVEPANPPQHEVEQGLMNILEDVRIERLHQKRYPGAEKRLDRGMRVLLDQSGNDPHSLGASPPPNEAMERPLDFILRYTFIVGNGEGLNRSCTKHKVAEVHKAMADWVGAEREVQVRELVLSPTESTQDATDRASKILELLVQWNPPTSGGSGHQQQGDAGDSGSGSDSGQQPGSGSQQGSGQQPGSGSGRDSGSRQNGQSGQGSGAGQGGGLDPSGKVDMKTRDQMIAELMGQKRRAASHADSAFAGRVQADANESDLDALSAPSEAEQMRSVLAERQLRKLAQAEFTSGLLRNRLMRLLVSNRMRPKRRAATGSRLSSKHLVRAAIDPSPRPFLQKAPREDTNTLFQLLLDASGSMHSNDAIGLAKLAVLDMVKAIDSVPDITTEVYQFPGGRNGAKVLKRGKTRFDQFRYRMMGLAASGGTPMLSGLALAAVNAARAPHPRKVMLLVTDGNPHDPAANIEAAERLRADGVDVMGIFIGETQNGRGVIFLQRMLGADHVTRVSSAAELPKALDEMARRMILHSPGAKVQR